MLSLNKMENWPLDPKNEQKKKENFFFTFEFGPHPLKKIMFIWLRYTSFHKILHIQLWMSFFSKNLLLPMSKHAQYILLGFFWFFQ